MGSKSLVCLLFGSVCLLLLGPSSAQWSYPYNLQGSQLYAARGNYYVNRQNAPAAAARMPNYNNMCLGGGTSLTVGDVVYGQSAGGAACRLGTLDGSANICADFDLYDAVSGIYFTSFFGQCVSNTTCASWALADQTTEWVGAAIGVGSSYTIRNVICSPAVSLGPYSTAIGSGSMCWAGRTCTGAYAASLVSVGLLPTGFGVATKRPTCATWTPVPTRAGGQVAARCITDEQVDGGVVAPSTYCAQLGASPVLGTTLKVVVEGAPTAVLLGPISSLQRVKCFDAPTGYQMPFASSGAASALRGAVSAVALAITAVLFLQ